MSGQIRSGQEADAADVPLLRKGAWMYRVTRSVAAVMTAGVLGLFTVLAGAASAAPAGGIKGDPQPELKHSGNRQRPARQHGDRDGESGVRHRRRQLCGRRAGRVRLPEHRLHDLRRVRAVRHELQQISVLSQRWHFPARAADRDLWRRAADHPDHRKARPGTPAVQRHRIRAPARRAEQWGRSRVVRNRPGWQRHGACLHRRLTLSADLPPV